MCKKDIWLEDMPLAAHKSSASLRAPVEIWKEIIDLVLFDPILISADPFYPGCNLHSAFNEWSDTERLRKCEVQRGLCRLVSRSWKALADSIRWQYFEPQRCQDDAQRLSQTKSARRLYFHPICFSYGRYEGGYSALCPQCPEYRQESGIMELFSQLDGKATNARVLELPYRKSPSSRVLRSMVNAFPNLKALTIGVDANPIPDIRSLVPILTFLSLAVDVDPYGQGPQAVQPAPIFSSLKTFKIKTTYEGYLAFIEDWDMPVLAHLEVVSPSSGLNDPEDDFTIHDLIIMFGTNLISLRVLLDDEYVSLSDSIWEDMPVLEYMGTTQMASSFWWPKSPPGGHPLRILAILDDESNTDQMPNVRLETFELTERWGNLTSIADLHSWEETPEDLLDDCKSGITFDHEHRLLLVLSAWECSMQSALVVGLTTWIVPVERLLSPAGTYSLDHGVCIFDEYMSSS